MIGRLSLVFAAVLLGSILTGLTATRSFGGLIVGVVGLPGISAASLFCGIGIFVLPLVLVFAIMFARSEWPLWLPVICTLLMWWNLHGTIRWTVYDSPSARQRQRLMDEIQEKLDGADRQNPRKP
ncbi:MAG TPA: hypothetical protein PLU30_14740 [Verrucomicrobiae bacterium]|nr:hypothetical protein [Verrucomicrobiae bacterium]